MTQTTEMTAALIDARAAERETGERRYIAVNADGTLRVVAAMPWLGEWYDSDGIRHG
jgi:hypothetical protein